MHVSATVGFDMNYKPHSVRRLALSPLSFFHPERMRETMRAKRWAEQAAVEGRLGYKMLEDK